MFKPEKFRSMFKPTVVFTPEREVVEEEPEDDDEEMIVVRPPKPPKNYLPGERLLRKINKAERKKRGDVPVDRISASLSRIMMELV